MKSILIRYWYLVLILLFTLYHSWLMQMFPWEKQTLKCKLDFENIKKYNVPRNINLEIYYIMFSKEFILSGIILLVIDYVYLHIISPYYKEMIFSIQKSEMKLQVLPALLCYALLIFGLNYFILKDNRSLMDAFLFGIVIYGVYDFTNLALLKNYSWTLGIIDTLWGGLLIMLTTYFVYLFK